MLLINKTHRKEKMFKKTIKQIAFLAFSVAVFATINGQDAFAAVSFNLSPMFQNITLVPGETYVGNFKLTNNDTSDESFAYKLSIEPFYVDDNNDITLTTNGDYNQIVEWITLSATEGVIAPNETAEIRFTIDVPETTAAGGQYASIMVRSKEAETPNDGIQIREIYQSAHLIYADVAGETTRKGDIDEVSVPGFLLNGKIYGSSKIKNNGNVHSRATATLQIFPLFSNEEVFTNEEEPDTVFIMPESTRTKIVSWDDTPSVGIFHVIYKVEFEGVESKVDKMVIVCPLWLLFIILLAIFLIIFKIWSGKKREKK